ncbi:MAG TPA: diaminopimelate decarboxylase [Spirochaetota bacterium]|nr:diaminopimelate decarboxylase [Spirochaetota bacterium]OPZ36289.1 MAG: Diaminopimelate decarboxylase [Spirochaetes bacterium ADurb.BinA120]HNU90626.1 diaminopimelate decarboxylase [Spirochaetota bacterium]HPO45357.1 diaminopimelate decarboxylase [Spirochaetota bacterium]HPV96804.1 diaminopimelate decarboxylase [Spirochaetota bacterium]
MNSYDAYFRYNDGELTCEGLPLREAAERFGTPLYVYTERGFRERYMEIDRALDGVPHLICYSIKSNSNVNILRIMADMGSGMDVVSGGEIRRALAAGVDPRKIVFAGVGKTDEEISGAIDEKILMFNCESFEEMERIDEISRAKGTVSDISIRVNPDVDANTHHYIRTGRKENKFGIDIDRLKERGDFIRGLSGLRLIGIHCHIGSQIVELPPFTAALTRLLTLIGGLKRDGFSDIAYINLGGGMGIRYRDEEFFPIEDWAREVRGRVSAAGLKLIVEPGRYISGNNGVLLVRLLYKKRTGDRLFLITDGGMNDLIRPSLYSAYQNILNCVRREGSEVADVVGPICESGDFFGKEREITTSLPGDCLGVMSSGAYGMAMASRYNSRRLPAEVLIGVDGSPRLIRRRETYEDMIAHELVP